LATSLTTHNYTKNKHIKKADTDKHSFSVLIVDQDHEVSDLVCRTLSSMGHRAFPASTALQAKEEYSRTLPDLVILDLTAIDGRNLDLCKWIKEQPEGNLVPILILTSMTDQKSKVDTLKYKIAAFEEGADDFLTKPFVFQELKARLLVLLRARTLSLKLIYQNQLLQEAQDKIILQERQLCATQLAGTAAHALGQPITALKLHFHLLESLPPEDARHKDTISAMKLNLNKLTQLIQSLKKVDAAKTEDYHSGINIFEVKEDE